MTKDQKIEKWIGDSWQWEAAIGSLDETINAYAAQVTRSREDTTRRQAKDEFWLRAAEYYGFKIDFGRETK